ncbi:hypothetical protein KP509_26G027800 [Ceratopteris richardii]|nr:hypothetical protein KP509_26G027800 [Ceratopteris richardii]
MEPIKKVKDFLYIVEVDEGPSETHYQQLDDMKRRLLKADQDNAVLREKLRKFEQSRVDTGFYSNDATPALLQARADSVKQEIQQCASSLFTLAESRNLALKYPFYFTTKTLNPTSFQGAKQMQFITLVLQASLSEVIFLAFENATYVFMFNGKMEPFDSPDIIKKRRMKMYNEILHMEPQQIIAKNRDFESFVAQKRLSVSKFLKFTVFTGSKTSGILDSDGDQFDIKFLRLCKAVWLLHLVAFACAPASAEIFRVSPDSPYMPDYMKENEDIQPRTDLVPKGQANKQRFVAFMTVPGFTLINSCIKADVCCVDSLC